MAIWHESTARVLETAIPEPSEIEKIEEKTQPELRVANSSGRSKVSSLFSLRNIVTTGIVVFCLCIMVNYNISINELNDEINSLQSNMVSLQSEYGRMESALEPTQSLPVIAERAQTELGMQRIEQNEVQYVNIYEEDTIQVAIPEQPEGLSGMIEQMSATIVNGFKKIFGEE